MLEQLRRISIVALALGLLSPAPAAMGWDVELVKPRPRPKRIPKPRPVARQLPKTKTVRLPNGVTVEMVLIPAGTFAMGSKGGGDEQPTHSVKISRPFYMGRYEVTQQQWAAVMGSNPSHFKGGRLPVEQVSWDDVQTFLRRLNSMLGSTYRLPTEAEWEYACRAGTANAYAGRLDAMAWFGDNSGDLQQNANVLWRSDQQGFNRRILDNNCRTHEVGTKRPNAWGLHDMHGNVWEWCQDWYGPYTSASQINPSGFAAGRYRVPRGGGWSSTASECRSADRGAYEPGYRANTIGFRLVRAVDDRPAR